MGMDFSVIRERASVDWFFQTFLQGIPKKFTDGHRYGVCPNCGSADSAHSVRASVRGTRWRCFRCGESGDVIDAAQRYWGLGPNDAVNKLAENLSGVSQEVARVKPQAPVKPKNYEAIHQVICRLVDAQDSIDAASLDYLTQVRKIPAYVAHNAVVREKLITLPGTPEAAFKYLRTVVGEPLMRESGLWKEGSKICAASYRPLGLISDDAASIEFKSIGLSREGTAKSLRLGDPLPWTWKGSKEGFFLTEGFMDMLTALAMKVDNTIVSVPGGLNWSPELFKQMEGQDVVCAFDNDETGNRGYQSALEHLTALNARVTRFELPENMDLNKFYVQGLR